MIRFTVALILAAFVAISAPAQSVDLPPRYAAFDWHRRVIVDRDSRAEWGVRLLDADSVLLASLHVTGHGIDGNDNTFGPTVTVACRLPDSTTVSRDYLGDFTGAYSILVSAAADSITFATGITEPRDPVGFITPRPVARIVPYIAAGRVTPVPDRFRCEAVTLRDSIDTTALMHRLATTTDPAESLWTYYDRDIDGRLSRQGGDYILATCRADDGTYKIIYLDGARERAADWAPGHIKGILTPTLIPGVYDLIWYQPDGTPITADTGATLDRDLLTLLFPRWKSTYRFRRLPPPPSTIQSLP